MTPDDIVAAARECVGTPFRHQGRLSGVGLDCAGVVVHVAHQVGVDTLDVRGYGRTPNKGQLESTLEAQIVLHAIPTDTKQVGDILLMRFLGEPQHLAIYTGENILHAYEAVGKCVEHRLDSRWLARIVRVYRFNEVSA